MTFADTIAYDVDNTTYHTARGIPVTGNVHMKAFGENGLTEALAMLDFLQVRGKFSAYQNKVHVGFSGWFNLDIMAVMQQPYGVFADINATQKPFWEATFATLAATPHRRDFPEAIATTYAGFSIRSNATLQRDINQYQTTPHFLSNDYLYDHLHTAARDGRMAAITLDILDTARIQQLAESLQQQNLQVGSVYISNIMMTFKAFSVTAMAYAISPNKVRNDTFQALNTSLSNIKHLCHDHDVIMIEGSIGNGVVVGMEPEITTALYQRYNDDVGLLPNIWLPDFQQRFYNSR